MLLLLLTIVDGFRIIAAWAHFIPRIQEFFF
jgi:hypothetical protein